MIDARDYKTHDELADAMQNEHDISMLHFLNKKLEILKASFAFNKRKYEHSIEEIKSKQLELQNNINEYYKKVKAQ